MAMIHYELLGSHPEVEHVDVEQLIKLLDNEADEVNGRYQASIDLEKAAKHFYGIRADDFMTIASFTDAIQAAEQNVKMH